MLNKEVFKDGILDLLNVFPNWNIEIEDARTMRTWYSFFQKMTDTNFKAMVSRYIREERFNPTIAGLLQYKEEGHYDSKSVDLGDVADDIYDDLLADYEGDKTI